MRRLAGSWLAAAAIAMTVVGGCTRDAAERPAPADPQPVQYRVDFGAAGTHGLLELDQSGRRVCLRLRGALPKAAHLHVQEPYGDTILVSFFEPPDQARFTCVEDVDPRKLDLAGSEDRPVYVDVHFDDRDDELVGELTPAS